MTDIIDDTPTSVGEQEYRKEKPLFADITLSPSEIMAHMPSDFVDEIKSLLHALDRGESVTLPEQYFRTKYGIETVERAKRIVRKLAGTLYRDVPYTVMVTREQDDSEISGSHDYDPKKGHMFTLETSAPPSRALTSEERPPVLLPSEHVVVHPRIQDLIKMIHEYSHAIYEETANKEHLPDNMTMEYMTVSGMLNEGFTTLIELRSCDYLIQNADTYSLTKADIVDLTNIQNDIQKKLASYVEESRKPLKGYEKVAVFQNMAYTEGYDFMKRLFDARGMGGVNEFVTRIDMRKVKQLRRSDPSYHAAFKSIDGMSSLVLAPAEHN